MNTKAKASYKVRNWKEYDAALKHRGSITFWVSEEVVEQWRKALFHATKPLASVIPVTGKR